MKNRILLLCMFLPMAIWAQQTPPEENECVVETKVGAELNWRFGKKKQYHLTPSIRSVHNNRKVGSSWSGYRGMAAEVSFSMPVCKYLRFFTDWELDVNEDSDTHLSMGTGVNSSYSTGRFSVGGELKYSTDRNLHYVDSDRNPHLKYKASGSIELLKNIWKFTTQITFPHSLTKNAITGLSLEGISAFTLSRHFGINCSFEWSNTFASGRDSFCPQLKAVFTI